MNTMDVAVATIRQEHRALGTVMEALQRLLAAVAALRAEPDFALFSAALYYIADFPERCHHPKEDDLLARARDCLAEEDWSRIASAFNANRDPLFGDDRREEFRRLYSRILNRLPRKIGMSAHHPLHEQ